MITSCNQKIIDTVAEEKLSCKNIDDLDMSLIGIHLNFIDQYIDVLNYEDPITQFIYRIENKIDKDSYSLNNLNFNPSLIQTNDGYFVDNKVNSSSFFYERNEAFTYQGINNLFMLYSFYLNNRLNFYERSYQTIEEALSSLGGIYNIIIYIMTLINDLISSSMILFNFNFLLNLFDINIDDIKKSNQKNIIDKKIKEVEDIKKNIYKSKKTNTRESIVNELENYNRKNTEEKEIIKVIPISNEKNDNNEIQKDKNIKNKEKLDEVEEEKIKGRSVFGYCEFFLYKITCGKKNSELEIYDNLMKQIISVENLIHNYLKTNNLLKNEIEVEVNT